MVTELDKSVRRIGIWSAVLCTVFSLTYIVAQLGEWAGLFGSSGGPHSQSTPHGLVVLLTPSLLLGLSFVVLMVSIHYYVETTARIWSHVAVVFASMYATLISIVITYNSRSSCPGSRGATLKESNIWFSSPLIPGCTPSTYTAIA